MRRVLALTLVIMLFPWAAPAGAARAFSPQEGAGQEIVIRTLHVPHFDIWLRADGVTWQGGQPGEVVTHPEMDILPAAIAERYDLVGPPEVTTEITPELYSQTKSPDLQQVGWWGKPWSGSWQQKGFFEEVYRYRPLEYYRAYIPVSWQEINKTRKAMIIFELKLSPYIPRVDQYPPAEKHPEGVNYVYPWDLRAEEEWKGQRFEPKVEGWRWKLPVVITWHLKEKPKPPDFYVKSLNPGTGEVEEGKRYAGTAVFGLKNTVSGPVEARLELTHNGYPVPGINGQAVTFNPGEEKSFTFNFTGQDRDSVLEAKIRPVSGQDANWADNSKRVVVPLRRQQQTGPGSLTFQAVSQTRKYARPPGTAKWTDWVTARLVPPEPVPPRGRVVSWRITSATLTYPKKNPNFTFGNPLPPVRTRTVQMTPRGHEAVAEFQEDWALDGAGIYNILTGQLMAAEPKYYTITASYTVEYTYEWEEEETDCSTDPITGEESCSTYTVTRSATATASGTVTGKLLVNGTGVDSRAQ